MKDVNGAVQGRISPSRMRRLDPDDLAARVLVYLAADPERISRFLALTGLDPATLRAASERRGFSTALLSYLGSDESLLIAFATSESLDPGDVGRCVAAATHAPSEEW